MRRAALPLPLTDSQREILQSLSRSAAAPHREVLRAMVLLLAGQGLFNAAVAVEVGVSPSTVKAWRDRFVDQGMVKFGEVAGGRGRKPSISAEKIAEIVRATQETKPAGQTHWSCRTMAKAQGVSPATVQRIWSSRGLKPHLVKTFKLSNDPKFDQKLIDVVGLYLNPPEGAVVFCMDEKSARAFGAIKQRIPGSSGPSVSQGVSVEVGESQAAIDLDIVIEYGVSVADLGRSIQRNVKQAVERMTGLNVVEVNVAVDDVYLGDDSDEQSNAPARVQ